MANVDTRSTLRTRVRQAADRVGSTFVTDAELNGWIDVGLSELHDILVTRFEDYFESSSTVTLVAGTSDYSLPSDFLKSTGVDFVSSGTHYTMRRYMPRERNRKNAGQYRLGDYEYRIVGSVIRFIPTPAASGTVTLYYIPQYVPLAGDSTVVESAVPQGWEEYAVLDAAIQVLLKDESDASGLFARKTAMLARIEQASEDRDAGEPYRIVDISGRRVIEEDLV